MEKKYHGNLNLGHSTKNQLDWAKIWINSVTQAKRNNKVLLVYEVDYSEYQKNKYDTHDQRKPAPSAPAAQCHSDIQKRYLPTAVGPGRAGISQKNEIRTEGQ